MEIAPALTRASLPVHRFKNERSESAKALTSACSAAENALATGGLCSDRAFDVDADDAATAATRDRVPHDQLALDLLWRVDAGSPVPALSALSHATARLVGQQIDTGR